MRSVRRAWDVKKMERALEALVEVCRGWEMASSDQKSTDEIVGELARTMAVPEISGRTKVRMIYLGRSWVCGLGSSE